MGLLYLYFTCYFITIKYPFSDRNRITHLFFVVYPVVFMCLYIVWRVQVFKVNLYKQHSHNSVYYYIKVYDLVTDGCNVGDFVSLFFVMNKSHDLVCLEVQHSLKWLLIHAEIMLQKFPAILFQSIIINTVPLSTCHTFSLHKCNEERLADDIL
jgi:hypothetical protein